MAENHGTIFKKDANKQKLNGFHKAKNQRASPYVTKRIDGSRYIKLPDNLPITPLPNLPNLPEDVQKYIDRMRKTEKLHELAKMSNEVLFKCKTVFPFDFFPDTLIIDKTKVNIIFKMFFWSETVHSILIKNIKDIQVDTNIFFAKMTIVPDMFFGEPTSISYMHKSCALEARRIIQGLMLCYKEGIDISDLDAGDIKNKIETAGTAMQVRYVE